MKSKNKLIEVLFFVAFTIGLLTFTSQTNFLTEQKKYQRVRTSIQEKDQIITKKLNEIGLNKENVNILIVAFKAEKVLDIYAKKKTGTIYKKLISYSICSSSGQLGPKRKQGDYQVPEGFYHINRFNPSSNFYLSLGLNYPNQSDKIKSKSENTGGDIFIHGACVTIGCMPMTDDKIKEIYLYAIYAKNNGQLNIPVYVFPFKMTDQNFKSYKDIYKSNTELVYFWKNLKSGYDKFEMEKMELKITVDTNGDYKF